MTLAVDLDDGTPSRATKVSSRVRRWGEPATPGSTVTSQTAFSRAPRRGEDKVVKQMPGRLKTGASLRNSMGMRTPLYN